MAEIAKEKLIAMVRYLTGILRTMQYDTPLPELPEGVSFRNIYTLAKHHALSGLIFNYIENDVRATGDERLISLFERDRAIAAAKHTVQTVEFSRLTDLFTKEKIRFLPMKGFVFGELWKKPEYRVMSDIDFCFDRESVKKVAELLINMGYKPEIIEDNIHDTFDKPPYLHVEAHKALRVDCDDGFDDWIRREDNPFWYELSPTDFVVFNVAHMYKHYSQSGGTGVRNFFDLHLYMRAYNGEILYKEVVKRLKSEGMEDFWYKVLRLSEVWFSDGEDFTSDDEMQKFEYFIAAGGSYGTVESGLEMRIKNKNGAFRYFLSRMFLPSVHMKKLYPWLNKMPFLLPVAHVVRWTRAIFNGRMKKELKEMKNVKNIKKERSENA